MIHREVKNADPGRVISWTEKWKTFAREGSLGSIEICGDFSRNLPPMAAWPSAVEPEVFPITVGPGLEVRQIELERYYMIAIRQN